MGLAMMEIILEVEEHFDVQVPDEVVSSCVTVADLHRDLVDRVARKGRARSPELQEEVYRDLVKIISEQMGLKPTDIRPESKWVGDITDSG